MIQDWLALVYAALKTGSFSKSRDPAKLNNLLTLDTIFFPKNHVFNCLKSGNNLPIFLNFCQPRNDVTVDNWVQKMRKYIHGSVSSQC
jgi:hypothetical protein